MTRCNPLCMVYLALPRINTASTETQITLINGNGPSFSVALAMVSFRSFWRYSFSSSIARHVFGTLIHLAHMSTRGNKNANFKVHLTLMDIHPAPLARILVIFSLLDQIRLSKDSSKRVELHAALFYLYTSVLMPDYCHQMLVSFVLLFALPPSAYILLSRVMQAAKSLVLELPRGTHSICQFLYVSPKSLPVVLDLLRYWSTPIPKSAKKFLELKSGLGSLGAYGSLGALADLFGSLSSQNKQLTGSSSSSSSDAYANPDAESSLFNKIHVVLPPRTLLVRHPALGKLVRTYQNAPETTYSAVEREIQETWDPNPTFFVCLLAQDGSELTVSSGQSLD